MLLSWHPFSSSILVRVLDAAALPTRGFFLPAHPLHLRQRLWPYQIWPLSPSADAPSFSYCRSKTHLSYAGFALVESLLRVRCSECAPRSQSHTRLQTLAMLLSSEEPAVRGGWVARPQLAIPMNSCSHPPRHGHWSIRTSSPGRSSVFEYEWNVQVGDCLSSLPQRGDTILLDDPIVRSQGHDESEQSFLSTVVCRIPPTIVLNLFSQGTIRMTKPALTLAMIRYRFESKPKDTLGKDMLPISPTIPMPHFR